MTKASPWETHTLHADARRIVVVGTPGSGKTTLARRLSEHLGIPHVELDAIRHGPNWTEIPNEIFRRRVSQVLSGDRWVADGNYSVIRDAVWPRANALVWLDYPLRIVMWRLFWRTLLRGVTKEELWNGNRERLWTQFCTTDSIFLWALRAYKRNKRNIPASLEMPEHRHLQVVHLPSTGGTWQWLSSVKGSGR